MDFTTGVWAAVLTPFAADGQLDLGVLRENMGRLAEARVDGIYCTDADGEFYALEHDEFGLLVEALGSTGAALGIPTHAGVTWANGAGTVERLRRTVAAGVQGAHVGHPMFLPMDPRSMDAFWSDVAAAVSSEFEVVHYSSGRLPNPVPAGGYARMVDQCPNLVATKHVGESITEFLSLVDQAPMIAHLTGEHAFTPFSMFGAVGVCSWFANFNAPWIVEWSREIRAENWKAATERQKKMHRFITLKRQMLGAENLHAVMNKAVSEASDYLISSGPLRRPYLAVQVERVQAFRQTIERELPEMIWPPT